MAEKKADVWEQLKARGLDKGLTYAKTTVADMKSILDKDDKATKDSKRPPEPVKQTQRVVERESESLSEISRLEGLNAELNEEVRKLKDALKSKNAEIQIQTQKIQQMEQMVRDGKSIEEILGLASKNIVKKEPKVKARVNINRFLWYGKIYGKGEELEVPYTFFNNRNTSLVCLQPKRLERLRKRASN